MLLGFHFTETRVRSRGSCPDISKDGGDLWIGPRTSRAAQEILFLKDPKTSEVVPGGVEAPVSSVGSVQTEAVQLRCYLGRAG